MTVFRENSLVISVALLFLGKGTFDSEIERYDENQLKYP